MECSITPFMQDITINLMLSPWEQHFLFTADVLALNCQRHTVLSMFCMMNVYLMVLIAQEQVTLTL